MMTRERVTSNQLHHIFPAHLVHADGVRAVVDEELVVAVHLELLEAQHEPLQDGLRLEGHHAVDVALVLREDHGAVHGARDVREEALVTALAQLADWNCKRAKKGACVISRFGGREK